jgi:tRNA nucleotidyltransferase (CCA-adding enzyme)
VSDAAAHTPGAPDDAHAQPVNDAAHTSGAANEAQARPDDAAAGALSAVLGRLPQLPGGRELLDLAAERNDVALVGGSVRDILLGRTPRELDVVVDADAGAFADALAGRLADATVERHERFNTAVVRWPGGLLDVAMRRFETYAAPGALPDVQPGTTEQDLVRRDFSINAIAISLSGEGGLVSAPNALADIAARKLRVLHEQSFLEDPTRILRLARYRARLELEVEPHTAELAEQAVAADALHSVSGTRLGAELRLALDEPNPLAPLDELDRMGVLDAWEQGVCFDRYLAATALDVLPGDGDPELLLCASMVVSLMRTLDEYTEGSVWAFLHDIELPTGRAQRVFSAGVTANYAARWLDDAETTGDLLDLLEGASVEGLALAAAIAERELGPRSYTRRTIEDWLERHRHIRLHITGEDLLAAGLPEGPEIGRRLERVFAMRMTGRVEEDREAELSAALSDD